VPRYYRLISTPANTAARPNTYWRDDSSALGRRRSPEPAPALRHPYRCRSASDQLIQNGRIALDPAPDRLRGPRKGRRLSCRLSYPPQWAARRSVDGRVRPARNHASPLDRGWLWRLSTMSRSHRKTSPPFSRALPRSNAAASPVEDVLADFGLTMGDLRKMAGTPGPEARLRMAQRVIFSEEACADIRAQAHYRRGGVTGLSVFAYRRKIRRRRRP
jgi:hypothetical protein